MVQRRQRNQILRLKREDGVWCSTEDEINGCIAQYFSNLFQGLGSRDMEPVLGSLSNCVTSKMNNKLLSPILPEEIKNAASRMQLFKWALLKLQDLTDSQVCFIRIFGKRWAWILVMLLLAFFMGVIFRKN